MSTVRRFRGCLLVVGLLVSPALSADRDQEWKRVEEAVKQGLPKTAIKRLQPILDAALKEQAYAEAIKALGRKIALQGVIEGNQPQEKIKRMQAEIAQAPAAMKPVLESILGHWYWHYFQRNRFRFLQRSATSEPPGDDFMTWDLPRLFAEIDQRLAQALAADGVLKTVPISAYDDLLVKGSSGDTLRPTLYDFLAHQAISFYSSGEQGAARPEDAFDLSAESPVFGSRGAFTAWEIQTTDRSSPIYKGLRLFQDLLRFHQDDDDPSALLDADLLRLQFGSNHAFGEVKETRHQAALKRFSEEHAEHPVSALALHLRGVALQRAGQLVEAHALATLGKRRFPESVGGRRCHNLIEEIEASTIHVSTERVWNNPWPTVRVEARNLKRVYFRIVAYPWEERLKRGRRPEQLAPAQRKELLAQKPTLSWSADLPPNPDFQPQVKEVAAPRDLPPGSYFLVSSANEAFSDQDNQVHVADFWVSQLALVVRTRFGNGPLEGFVLDAESGEPVVEAVVRGWRSQRNQWAQVGTTSTDENGMFRFAARDRGNLVLHAAHKQQTLASGGFYSVGRRRRVALPQPRTFFFTDRSLYRPGQTVRYKGLCVQIDRGRNDYRTLPDQEVTAVFLDSNGKEIARQQHMTNDYGSFSGSFTAPRDRLRGGMTIRVDGVPQGATQVSVEEYKRPKFQVTLDAPREPGKLDGEVKLDGQASNYTGSAVDGGRVKWRVVRQVRFPIWWGWRRGGRLPRPGASQEIAHGAATSGADGSFSIVFRALPDRKVPADSEPTFQFTVYTDVTSPTGETRSTQRVLKLGYTALQASLTAPEWLTTEKPAALTIRTNTLNGESQAAEGVIQVYRLKQPERVTRARWAGPQPLPRGVEGRPVGPPVDPSNPLAWPLEEVVFEQGFETDGTGKLTLLVPLPAGPYRAVLKTQDRFGKAVKAELPMRVLDPAAERLALKVPQLFAAPRWTLEPGDEFLALWGSGYDRARAFVEIEHRGQPLRSFWTDVARTQVTFKQAIDETMRGGFTVRVTMIRENRAYFESRKVEVPWSQKELTVKWEHLTSKLEPGKRETWTAVVTGKDAKTAAAEMVATLYDASLDAYRQHQWMRRFNVFWQDVSNLRSAFENRQQHLRHLHGNWRRDRREAVLTYHAFPQEIIGFFWGYQFPRAGKKPGPGFPPPVSLPAFGRGVVFGGPRRRMMRGAAQGGGGGRGAPESAAMAMDAAPAEAKMMMAGAAGGLGGGAPGAVDLSSVSPRTNLQETAFFFPHLVADEEGQVRLEFAMPEALTEWKFMGFAHDAELRGGYLEGVVVTAKDLMVEPNPPRFVREGDLIEFTVKVSNQSAGRQTGSVRLTLADARTGRSVDGLLGNTTLQREFDIAAQESRTYSWRLKVPDEMGFLTYKAVGSTGRLSDGEEGYLPVLSRRVLVTESLPLPLRGKQKRRLKFKRLAQSGQSDSLRHQSLTVQMVSNPSWYAVMALPYLMEDPHDCCDQIFNRLYANALAQHIAASDARIQRVFEQWRATEALDSPLEKNADLKSIALQETPWLKQAQSESQARRNVGVLFDANRLESEIGRAVNQLAQRQRPDGAWPWFSGGRANHYITLYITTGFGRLRHLGVTVDETSAVKAVASLDGWIDGIYRDIVKRQKKSQNHLTRTIALYLYGRSFFLQQKPVAAPHREAVDYFLSQAREHWLDLAHRQSQAHLAIALKRFGDEVVPVAIMRSIKQRSVHDRELGRFWREQEHSWWWYRAPIETQAMMIEAFDEVMGDVAAVEECKVWLLKQKQTQAWKTSKSTADAVYALLLRGSELLASDALVQITLGGQRVQPAGVEAGTGFFEQRFAGPQITPQQADVLVEKSDPGVAWGSLHWQYLEEIGKVRSYRGTPLKLEKRLFTKVNSKAGPVLKKVDGPLAVGDQLICRVVLRTDRDMEFVHLKDARGSGTEPVNVLSKYHFQDGLYYYQSTGDTASHFYIDYLPKGTYVFEYAVRVQHRGRYESGVAQIQCLYAPEFNSHSASVTLRVK